MNVSMSRIFLMLLLFAFIFFCQVHGDGDPWKNDTLARERYLGCEKDLRARNQIITVTVAYFSKRRVNTFRWTNFRQRTLPVDAMEYHLLSICLCRDSYDSSFFMMPYGNLSGDDMVVVCVYGENFSSIGVYDDEELFDLLMVKYQELIPVSVIDPVSPSQNDTHSGCYDLDHFPTAYVMGQKTCLFSAFADNDSMTDNYLYSGPLMSLPFLNQSAFYFQKHCYSTFENSVKTENDSCFFNHTLRTATFGCCCAKDPELCSIPQKLEKHNYCFAGSFTVDKAPPDGYNKYPLKNYFNKFYKPACMAKIIAGFDKNKNDGNPNVKIEYGSADSCEKIDSLNITSSDKFCSGNPTTTKRTKFTMTKCCNDKNLCNFGLIPAELFGNNWENSKKCGTLEAPALYARLNLTCGAYYDLTEIKENENNYLGLKKNLYDGFNAKFIHESRRSRNGTVYIIAKIIKADHVSCTAKVFQDKDVNKYFPFFNCGEKHCVFGIRSYFSFQCEQSNAQSEHSHASWFCYVKIIPKQKDEFVIEAGFLEIKDNSPCYTNDIFSDTYCCVNVFDQNQVGTKCTMENMTLAYQKRLQVQKNASHELPDSEKTFTECLQRDIGPEQKCPGNDGCFEIRSLTESDESQVVEPAGCLGLAEDYTLDNLDMTNLALGCRADLNSNRCSMVQSPSGEERIVCCCNHPDENDECKTKADELPQTVGKPISSFRTIKS